MGLTVTSHGLVSISSVLQKKTRKKKKRDAPDPDLPTYNNITSQPTREKVRKKHYQYTSKAPCAISAMFNAALPMDRSPWAMTPCGGAAARLEKPPALMRIASRVRSEPHSTAMSAPVSEGRGCDGASGRRCGAEAVTAAVGAVLLLVLVMAGTCVCRKEPAPRTPV